MENLTGGTPPVRYLPCVVPCKLYFTKIQILRLLADVSEDTTVHIQNVAVHEVRIGRCQEHSRAYHILGRAQRSAGVFARINWSNG